MRASLSRISKELSLSIDGAAQLVAVYPAVVAETPYVLQQRLEVGEFRRS